MLRFVPRAGASLVCMTIAVLVGVLALAGCGVTATNTTAGTTANPVPWINSAGAARASAAVQAARACRAADLSAKAGNAGAYHGMANQEIILTNQGQDACFIPGPPAAEVILGDGSRRPVTQASDPTVAHRLDLAAGQTAQFYLATPAGCAGADQPLVATQAELTLTTHERIAVTGTWVNVRCGAPVVAMFYAGPAPAATVPASGLTATIAVPSSVARGSVLRYLVTLTNPTNGAIALNPCPSYTQTMGTSPTTAVHQTLVLNCAAMPTIGAGASVVFEMQFAVPANFPSGGTKLGWFLEVPNGYGVGATVSIA